MFTGIIEELGTVREAAEGRLVIDCELAREAELGESIAINGVDLTVAEKDDRGFFANVMPETYRRTNLSDLRAGDQVNLERSLTLSDRLSGHLVRGVVEATGTLESLTPEGNAILATYKAPPEILRYAVVKGPITVDGASLTIIAKGVDTFTVSLVEYTQDHTNHTRKSPGDRINLESDIIARYVGQLLESAPGSQPDAG